MEERQAQAITQMMDAVNAGDAQRYASLYAEDAVVTIHGSGVLAGRRAIEEYEVELLRQFPGARLGFYDMWQKGSLAVVHYAVECRTPGRPSMGHEGLLFYRFHPSGLIAEERRYLDSLTPMAQMGMLGAAPARSLPLLPAELRVHVARGSPDASANVAAVTASFAALDSNDEPAFLSTLAADVVLDDLTHPQPFVGRTGVQTWLETWTQAVPGARSEITSILGVGELVLVEAVVRSSEAFTVHRAAIVRVKAGKLTHVALFMNGKELARE